MGEFFTGIFAFLGAFFVFGTLWFWVVGAAFFGLMIYWTEDDSNFLASLLLAAFIWTTASVNGFSIVANPILWLKLAALYFVVGTVWSFLKWFSYALSIRRRLRDLKAAYLKNSPSVELQDDGTFFDEDFPAFATYLRDNSYIHYGYAIDSKEDVNPTMGNNLRKLVRWIVWWPFSAFWTILNDPIRRLAEFIVRRLRTAYDGISISLFKNEV